MTKPAVSIDRRDVADTSSSSAFASGFGTGNHLGSEIATMAEPAMDLSKVQGVEQFEPTVVPRDGVVSYLTKNANPDEMRTHMVVDVGQLERQVSKWHQNFPRVCPFYAVKSLPDPVVVDTLAKCGISFDCASKMEIEIAQAAGVEGDRIIFANPCKFPQDILFANRQSVRKMTFDNSDELEKVARLFPEAELVLRIVTDDSASVCRLSNKYGAAIEDCMSLLQRAHELRLKVIGVSFHVGSGASDPFAFVDALQNARKVFDMAAVVGFPEFGLLDIGGGFPGDDDGGITIAEIAEVINPVLDRLFPPAVKVISEPGRFFSHSSATLAARIMSRRLVQQHSKGEDDPDVLLYMSDGVYGSFNCMLYDHYTPKVPTPVLLNTTDQVMKTRVFGPTCDGLDTIYESIELPLMHVGDWLVFDNMGAYTLAAASRFNGIERPHVSYIRT